MVKSKLTGELEELVPVLLGAHLVFKIICFDLNVGGGGVHLDY
jgi:hypothetical protein